MSNNRSIAKELIFFSLPLILSGMLQQLYGWADAYILGHSGPLGELMLAGVGATNALTTLLIYSILGFTVGISVLAAQEYGRGNIAKIRRINTVFLPILIVAYVIFTLLMIILARPVLALMDTPADIFNYAKIYLQVVIIGVPALAVYNLFAALFRAVGDTKVAFFAVAISTGINVLLDMLFVWVFSWGVGGAAAATVISQVIMMVFIIIYGYKTHPELMPKKETTPAAKDIVTEGCHFGLPPALQNCATSAGSVVLQNFTNSFLSPIVLMVTTAYRVDSLMLLPIINLSAAVSSLVARSKGAEEPEKIKKYFTTSLWLMLLLAGALTLMLYFLGGVFIGFFGVTGEALAAGGQFFKDLSIFYLLFGVANVFRGALEGIGDITYCSIVGIITLLIRIALSYFVLCPIFAERTIAFAEGFAWCFMLILLGLRVIYKRRELNLK